MRFLIAILIVLIASVATAQPLVLSQTPADGVYVLTVRGGQATLQRATVLQVDPIDPIDPIDPVDPPVSAIAKDIQSAVEAIPAGAKRNETAAKIAGTWQLIAAQIKDGKIPQASIPAVINGIKSFLTMGDSKWDAVINKTLGYIATCASPAACAEVFTQAATGILATIPEPQRDVSEVELSEAMQDAGFSQELVAKAELAGFDWAKWLPIILQLIMAIVAGL